MLLLADSVLAHCSAHYNNFRKLLFYAADKKTQWKRFLSFVIPFSAATALSPPPPPLSPVGLYLFEAVIQLESSDRAEAGPDPALSLFDGPKLHCQQPCGAAKHLASIAN